MRDAAIDSHRPPRRSGAGRSGSERTAGDLSSAAVAAQRLGGALDRPRARGAPTGRLHPAPSRWRAFALLRTVRPVKALTTAVFSAALVGIVANAVLFQKSGHPAAPGDGPHAAAPSLPAAVAKDRGIADAGPTGAVAPSSERTAPAPAASEPDMPVSPTPPAPQRHAPAKHALAKPPAGGDAIGRMLGADGKAPAKAAESKPTLAKPDPVLLRAQRQLKKLGYAVEPDGRMDGTTRQAIKRFSHDHHVAADGGLTPKLTRAIADASSAPVKPAAAVPEQPKAQ